MKNELLNTMADAIGFEKATALLNAYVCYCYYEFGADEDECLTDSIGLGEMPIAYTTSEDGQHELQATYDWHSEEMTYIAGDMSQTESLSIDDVIEYGFDFSEAICHCEDLLTD